MNKLSKQRFGFGLVVLLTFLGASLAAQKFHVAGQLVKCVGSPKVPDNAVLFIEGETIPEGCEKIEKAEDAVIVAKGTVYNQDAIQGLGLPGSLWRKSEPYNATNLEVIEVGDRFVHGTDNHNIGIGKRVSDEVTGTHNIGIGPETLPNKLEGDHNIGLGYQAGRTEEGLAIPAANLNRTILMGYQASVARELGAFSVGSSGRELFTVFTSGGVNFRYKDGNLSEVFKMATKSDRVFAINRNGTLIQNSLSDRANILELGTKENGTRFVVTWRGWVGIGTESPKHPLTIELTNGLGDRVNIYGYGKDDWNNLNPDQYVVLPGLSVRLDEGSLLSESGVFASLTYISSDARNKINRGLSNNEADLATLRQIKITDYIKKNGSLGFRTEKKVMAQELEQVYPVAVSKKEGVVGDIFLPTKKATLEGAYLALEMDTSDGDIKKTDSSWLQEHRKGVANLGTLKQGEKIKLFVYEDTPKEKFLAEIKEAPIHQVAQGGKKLWVTLTPEEAKKLKEKKIKSFVYGRHVKDYRTVDYDALSSLNVSATQALAKELQALETDRDAMRWLMGSLVSLTFLLAFLVFKKRKQRT